MPLLMVVLFFFQAEDGIRDHCVTGVQTCALPIYRTAMILGGSGLVGHAVARRLLAAAPRRIVLVALFEEEVKATAEALEPYRGRAAIEVEWGNVFVSAALARLEHGALVANAEHRAVLLRDALGELTDDVLHRSFLYQLLIDRKSTRLNSSHTVISYAVFCLKKKR